MAVTTAVIVHAHAWSATDNGPSGTTARQRRLPDVDCPCPWSSFPSATSAPKLDARLFEHPTNTPDAVTGLRAQFPDALSLPVLGQEKRSNTSALLVRESLASPQLRCVRHEPDLAVGSTMGLPVAAMLSAARGHVLGCFVSPRYPPGTRIAGEQLQVWPRGARLDQRVLLVRLP